MMKFGAIRCISLPRPFPVVEQRLKRTMGQSYRPLPEVSTIFSHLNEKLKESVGATSGVFVSEDALIAYTYKVLPATAF